MQIEAGKYYRTRDGRKAFVAACLANPFCKVSPVYSVLGFLPDNQNAISWTATGSILREGERPADLVAEWVDPPTCRQVCERLLSEALAAPPNVPLYFVEMAREALKHDGR